MRRSESGESLLTRTIRGSIRGMRLLAAILALLVGVSCASGGGDGPTVIRLGHIGFPGSPFDHGARRFKELVEARFPGRVEVRVFGAAQLGEDKEMLEGLRLGALEMHLPSSVLHSVAPEFGIFDLPFLIRDRDHFERIADGPIGRSLADGLEEQQGLVLLAFWENGFRVITNNVRPVVTPADLAGIRLRTPKDPERVRLFSLLGASPASMSFGEVFSALRQGVVDGQENPLAQLTAARFHEVQEYLSVTNHVYTPSYPVMRTGFLNGLPEDVQRGIRNAAGETGDWLRSFLTEEDERLIAELETTLAVNQVDRAAFERASVPMFDHYRERFGSGWIEEIRRLAE